MNSDSNAQLVVLVSNDGLDIKLAMFLLTNYSFLGVVPSVYKGKSSTIYKASLCRGRDMFLVVHLGWY